MNDWQPFDPDDKATWPDEGENVLVWDEGAKAVVSDDYCPNCGKKVEEVR